MKRNLVLAGSAMLLALSTLAGNGTKDNSSTKTPCCSACTTHCKCDKSCCTNGHCDKSKCTHETCKSNDCSK